MKKKMTLQKATIAAGVVVMSVGLFNAYDTEANEGCYGYMCCSANASGCIDEWGMFHMYDEKRDRRWQGDTCTL
jgi:hypothetical protein